jgi:hypothetical protein
MAGQIEMSTPKKKNDPLPGSAAGLARDLKPST